MKFVAVAAVSSLWEGEMTSCSVGSLRLVVVRGRDYVAAFEDRCAHMGQPLSQGSFERDVITCRAHLWQYDARTGIGINPSTVCVRRFDAKVERGEIWVEVPDEEGGSLG